MNHFRLSLISAALTSLLFTSNANAAAFQFYEMGTPIIGTAAVGQAAVANDASTAYYNPAGMSQLPGSHFMLGAQAILPAIAFSKNRQISTIRGSSGGNAGALTPGMDMYAVYGLSPCWKLGLSFTSPYGGLLNYNNGWVGRFNVQNLQMYVLDLNPVISYQYNNWLSLGAGLVIEYANLYQTAALPLLPDIDGQATIRAGNTSPGINVGVLITPTCTTKIGVSYRSQIVHKLRGNVAFFRLGIEPATSTQITMPAGVIASVTQDVSCRTTLLGELGWTNWKSMRAATVRIANFSTTTRLDWRNTYRIGVGSQFKYTPDLLLQMGISYDSSATKAKRRTPDLPADKQLRIGAGFIYSMCQIAKIGLSYEYLNLGKAPIHNRTILGEFSGSYHRNFANIVQASVDVAI